MGTVVALVMELLVWFVPSFVGNAVCVAIVGFVLGPLFPISCVSFLSLSVFFDPRS